MDDGFPPVPPVRPRTGAGFPVDPDRPALRFEETAAATPFVAGGLFHDAPAGSSGPHEPPEQQDEVEVATDAELRELVDRVRRRGDAPPPARLLDGSLRRALLGRADAASEHLVDLGSVIIDGRRHWFTSQLVARRDPYRGRSVVVANLPWSGAGFTSPLSDPCDGVVEVIDAVLGVADQLRMRAGMVDREAATFRGLRRSVVSEIEIELGRPTPIFLDGEQVSIARYLSLSVEPGALVCRT